MLRADLTSKKLMFQLKAQAYREFFHVQMYMADLYVPDWS